MQGAEIVDEHSRETWGYGKLGAFYVTLTLHRSC